MERTRHPGPIADGPTRGSNPVDPDALNSDALNPERSRSGSDRVMRDVAGWDVHTWSAAFRFWGTVIDDAATGRSLQCLEIGAGPGGPSLWLALRGHRVVCSNRSDTELLARPLHEKYGVLDRIEYQDVDVTDIPWENHFDVVVFKSVLGGIGADPQLPVRAMAQIHRALKPSGLLLYAENARGTVLHRVARWLAYRVRNGSWRFLGVGELRRLLSIFRTWELHTTGVAALFGTTEARRERLAAADSLFLTRVTPPSWRYVAFGVAVK